MKQRSASFLASLSAALLSGSAFAFPAITDVAVQQRHPWDGKVDIIYTVSGDIISTAQSQGRIPSLKVTATDQETGTSYTATSLSGDTGLADGTHSLVWDMATDGLTPQSTNMAFSVSCKTTQATYCVIDLSAGSSASSYPVTYFAEPPQGGFNVDEYKTTKLVLRRIEAGTFIMGEDQTNTNHRVTLTKPFFIGVFEVTQKQYQLVTGSNPSYFSGDKNPVDSVSYDAIRGSSNGANWPSSNAVDSSSFVGKLRARTGIDFDLPTEVQWEYVCRAGTMTTYSYGGSVDGNYMWYLDNSSSQTHEVGTKQPNPWGLYDMHGNVWEWCLDWYDSTIPYGIDPKGPSSGATRVRRGGAWEYDANGCTASYRNSRGAPWDEHYHGGFRLALPCAPTPSTYCIIDLSAGAEAPSYPVTYLSEPPQGGFNVDDYKTTKLVLRCIEAGSFIMGEDQSDESHRVTLTKPFFLGLFEVTQKQYQLVMGSNPSSFSGDKLPVEQVDYDAIRGSSNGAQWPSSNAVDSTSFIGKLRERTGLDIDLPTEAQWEYACRAGTTTTYSYGNSASGNYMWYSSNSSDQTHEVGTKQPNPWGLYDMHGNVWEWCLDCYGTLSYGTDPKGSSSGSDRVFRGGSWYYYSSSDCTSFFRGHVYPSYGDGSYGFRLASTFNESLSATYCVIDLSAGAGASSYPVTYLATPPSGGFNVNEYKTTKLVLKRIEAGTFIMGDDQANESHRVTLTKPFYIGLFEMTQKQWTLVMGSNPSGFSGDKRPVENVTHDAIRGSSSGAQWPTSNAVDSSSFLGKFRARTGLDFDLPTEAQWEYACRAGTTTTYSYGDSENGNYMWYKSNSSSQTHEVGTKQPNPWGLYDMHGNVWECCLDWRGTLAYGTDPKGSSSGSYRVIRGGSWYFSAAYCPSSYQYENSPSQKFNSVSFRLARTLNESISTGTICSGDSEPVSFDLTPATPVISPVSGVVAGWPVSVSISCATEGATIHYTTDGSEPTADSPVYSRFRVSERTTVKAVAVKNGLSSIVAVAEFAAGQCSDPVITPADGISFEHSGQTVSIDWQGEDGTLRYTTDGSDPTAESPAYGGPFTIDETIVVKAKAFGNQFFDSAIVTAALTRVWVNVATPTITAASSFTGSKTSVDISCATEGAIIRYTLNGNEPNSHSTRYTGPFYVTDSCTVKAYAVCADYLNSEIASFAIEKIWGIGDTLGAPDHAFSVGGDLPFVRVDDATAPLGESMKSGTITHEQTSTLTTTVIGPGTISFQWKTSCEKDPDNWYKWDHAEFEVDGDVVAYLDGESGWQTVSHEISGTGPHTLLWRYVKDDVESEGDDCCWVADYQWASDYTETQTTDVPVPYVWLRDFYPEISGEYEDYETAAHATAENGVNPVWECYVAGLDPTDEDARFLATIAVDANGKPEISHNPPLTAEEEAKREYRILGAETLDSPEPWTDVTDVSDFDAAGYRFFKVKVRMKE